MSNPDPCPYGGGGGGGGGGGPGGIDKCISLEHSVLVSSQVLHEAGSSITIVVQL